MSSFPVPTAQDKLIRAVLRSIFADHYPEESNPHADAESEYAAEQVAIAARDLTRAVDALDPDRQPIGWDNPAEPAKPATTWTGPDGTVYDLGHGWYDRFGSLAVCIGWIVPFDGERVPFIERCNGDPLDAPDLMEMPELIERFGPLTPRAEDDSED